MNAERLSDADSLNGIEWRGTASFNPRVFRETTGRGEWDQWRDGGGVAAYSLQTLGMAIWMRKQNGQWSVEHSGQPFLFGTLQKIECSEVPGGSPILRLTPEVARDLAITAIPDRYHPGVTFAPMKNIPVKDGFTGKPLVENTRKVEQILDLLRKYGVQAVNPHVYSGYYGVDRFSAPAAWEKYRLASTWLSVGNTPIPRFRLSEAINLEVESIDRSSESTATATIRIRYEGCSPICALANDLRALGTRSWESLSGRSARRSSRSTTPSNNDRYWGDLVFQGDQRIWPFKSDWPRTQRIQVYYTWNFFNHAWEVTRVGEPEISSEAVSRGTAQQSGDQAQPQTMQPSGRPTLKSRKEPPLLPEGSDRTSSETTKTPDRPIQAADLARAPDVTQQQTSEDSIQTTGEDTAPCDSTRPDIVVSPKLRVQVDLKPHCWSPWIQVADGEWEFNTIGDSRLVEIIFRDGYRYTFQSKNDDFQIDPNRVRIFRFRGTGRVEIIAH